MGDEISLAGRVALVTGAGRRLGRAFAEGLAARGASVAVHYGSSAAGAAEAVAAAVALGVRAVALEADLADPAEASALVARAAAELGPVDLLVNSASIFEPLAPLATSLEAWDRHMAVNLRAPMLLCQAFARQDLARGDVVSLLDWRALRPGPDHFPYTVSKAALAAMTKSLAVALAPRIRVNGLALGAILPPAGGAEGDPIASVPAGRWAEVDEAVEALAFLLGGPAYVTGEILHLDGGRHLT